MTLLRPTIRAAGSELWASWNPRRKTDAVDDFFRGAQPVAGASVICANWRDNPWFPAELEAERVLDLARYPDRYDHIIQNLSELKWSVEGLYRRFWSVAVIALLISARGGLIYLILTRVP